MEYRKFDSTYLIRMDRGEEILEQLRLFAQAEGVRLASIQAIGAVNDFTVGLFHTGDKKYLSEQYTGDHEIVSLTGTIDTMDGAFYCHLHMSARRYDGRVLGGHLNRAVVSATCEMVVTVLSGTIDRVRNEEIGLNLWKFD